MFEAFHHSTPHFNLFLPGIRRLLRVRRVGYDDSTITAAWHMTTIHIDLDTYTNGKLQRVLAANLCNHTRPGIPLDDNGPIETCAASLPLSRCLCTYSVRLRNAKNRFLRVFEHTQNETSTPRILPRTKDGAIYLYYLVKRLTRTEHMRDTLHRMRQFKTFVCKLRWPGDALTDIDFPE